MKKIIMILSLFLFITGGCTRASKSCKTNQKKVKQMRKSGQLQM